MLIPIELLKKYVDINIDNNKFVSDFSLKSAEVDSFKPFTTVKGLVIGKIIEIEDHPDSNHLHITTVDFGDHTQKIVCGAPNVKVGGKVIVATEGVELPGGTIKKAVIRGVESNGMNCALEELGIDHKFQGYDGIYYLDQDAPLGADPIEYLHLNDDVLEIELTPNRQDLLSIIGVAYDTKAMLNSTMHFDDLSYEKVNDKADILVSTETDNCYRYLSNVIKGVKIKESPAWLKGALMKMNIRPINNVVDITNYVLMVTGQPLHAFDYDQITTKKIVVRQAKENETIITLDNKERVLTTDDLVITDGIKPVCLAGVMGGLNSEVENNTTNIFLESAIFAPKNIKNTSRRLDLMSEASMRFEKGINPKMTKYALDLATKMFIELCGGKCLSNPSSFDNLDESDKEVSVSLTKINQVLGRTYTLEEVENVFKGLSFEYKLDKETFTVSVPKRRPDIETYQDLIEEVVRIDGYSKIEAKVPASYQAGGLTEYQKFLRTIRHTLSNHMNEVVTYSLTTKEKAAYFDNEDIKVISIMNPLTDDRESMRHSTIPSLLECIEYNKNRKQENNLLFEIGRCYKEGSEDKLLSGALTGVVTDSLWQGKKQVVDFFYVKGLIVDLFDKLSIKNYQIVLPKTPLKGLHPGVSASIILGKEEIGFIGKLHPDTEKFFNTKDTFVFEINLEKLFTGSHPLKTVKEISKYPQVSRDLALIMDDEISADKLVSEIQRVESRLIKSIRIFDLYKGESIGKGKKQIALTITFQDMTKTFETSEVDGFINKILKHLEELNITLRS